MDHLVFYGAPQKRLSFVADVDAALYELFQPGDHHIAQLELAMILYGLIARPSDFRGRRGVWFVDNTAALMALIRGRSSSGDLSRLSHLIHLCLFALDCTLCGEWTPSKCNWAEDISRLGWADPWPAANGFHVFPSLFSARALDSCSPCGHQRTVLEVHWAECLGCVPLGWVPNRGDASILRTMRRLPGDRNPMHYPRFPRLSCATVVVRDI